MLPIVTVKIPVQGIGCQGEYWYVYKRTVIWVIRENQQQNLRFIVYFFNKLSFRTKPSCSFNCLFLDTCLSILSGFLLRVVLGLLLLIWKRHMITACLMAYQVASLVLLHPFSPEPLSSDSAFNHLQTLILVLHLIP